MNLFPRLRLGMARRLADELSKLPVAEARARSSTDSEFSVLAPTGGTPVSQEALLQLQDQLRDSACRLGYPDAPNRAGQAEWDASAALILHHAMGISPAEAMHAGVWAFMGCVLLPDLVRWRFFGGTAVDRFLGANRGIRNAFGRLWWRAELLGAGEGEEGRRLARRYLVFLGEDQLVQLTERPDAFSDRRLARAVAKCWVRLADQAGGRAERLMRESVKRVRRRLAIASLELLPEEVLVTEIESIFEETLLGLAVEAGGDVREGDGGIVAV